MANFGKRPINDANAYKTQTSSVFYHGGEQRIDRRPYGKCERFVDAVGNVITFQLATPGDPKAMETAMRLRAEKHKEGWVEHAKCPLKHGTRYSSPIAERDFRQMKPGRVVFKDGNDSSKDKIIDVPDGDCAVDPKVMSRTRNGELQADFGCPHVEWLIAYRVDKEKTENAKRNSQRAAAEKRKEEADALQAAQLEMVKEQLEERKTRKREKKAPTE
jgi:hypothetical protein